MNQNEYWLQLEDREIIGHMDNLHGDWTIWGANPVMQAWVRNSLAYYSTILDATDWNTGLVFDGDQGELVRVMVPQARKLIRQLVTITTKNKLAFQAIARSKDSGAVSASRLCNALTGQIAEDKNLDKIGKKALEDAYVYGDGFISSTWRTDKGEPYAKGPHGIIYSGDCHIRNHSVFDVYYDYELTDWDSQPFVEVRGMQNKWDLIAKYPDLKDDILKLQTVQDLRGPQYTSAQVSLSEDQVYVYEMFVRPSPALPKGRLLIYSDQDTVYYDGPNKYETIPVEKMSLAPIEGLGMGYALLSDLLPAQEILDMAISSISSNQSAFAVQNVLVPRGAGISAQEIMGMNFIEYDPLTENGGGKPEPLQLTKSAPETFKLADTMMSQMEMLSDVNSALRGTPPPGVTSGVAIATLTTNALEFINAGSAGYNETMEKTMMHSINAFTKFGEVEHYVRMSGSNKKTYDQSFTGDELEPIQRVKLSLQNPLMQTMSGRVDIAEKMIQAGLIKRPQEYISILEGAPLESLYSTELSAEDLTDTENERLLAGQPVVTMITDDHAAHVHCHAALLNEQEVRENPEIWKPIMDHIQEHRSMAAQEDPMLAAMVRTGMMPQIGPMGPGGQPPPGEMDPEGGMSENLGPPGISDSADAPAEPLEDPLGRI